MSENLWRKRVLIPFWTIQLVFVILLLVVAALALGYANEADRDGAYYDGSGDTYRQVDLTAVNAVVGVYIGISSLTVLFDIFEIVQFARKKLSPVVAVTLNSIATLVWTVIFVLNIIGAARASRSALGVIFILVVFAMALGKLIYCSVVLHRFRKGRVAARGAYSAPVQQAEAGFDPSPNSHYTAYNPAGGPQNPFSTPSRQPSPAPVQPGFGGAAHEYYGNVPQDTNSYEMSQTGLGHRMA